MHKRKHRKSIRDGDCSTNADSVLAEATGAFLYVQAHEADIVRGRLSWQSLECRDPTTTGSGLIRWGPERPNDTVTISPHASPPPLWVDRYDVRLLLDRLPDFRSENTPPLLPASPTGWSDLDSDSEDTFFLSPDELEDYHREKRRRLIDRGREERLRALATIDNQGEDPDPWASDEEPDEAQRELIRRTAHHVASSPNPGQLEMRILTNYGTDKRFAFLRGRWSRAWRTEKERARRRQAEEKKPQLPTALGGLASYGDSDTEDGPSEEPKHVADAPRARDDDNSNEDDIKEARRARAREWSARRRVEQASQPADDGRFQSDA